MSALALATQAAPQPAPPCENFRIGRYESSPWGFSTNSWWVEGPDGVVVIDTQFLPSATAELVASAEAYTGKRVVLAFVLHPNPDKFNGTAFLTQHGVRVVTSQQVAAAIPAVDALRRRWFYDRYQPDYPATLVVPESLGDKTTTIAAAGLVFTVHILGPSASAAHIAVQIGDHLFVGDMLANRHHAWLELAQVDAWLAALELLKTLPARYLYPGRGYAAGPALIDAQARYLEDFRAVVRAREPSGELSEETAEAIGKAMEERYPDYGNTFFLRLGASALWKKYANEGMAP